MSLLGLSLEGFSLAHSKRLCALDKEQLLHEQDEPGYQTEHSQVLCREFTTPSSWLQYSSTFKTLGELILRGSILDVRQLYW